MKKITGLILCAASTLLFAKVHIVTLDEAITIALQNNNSLKISQTSIAIAQSMYEQAMSANYPTLDFNVLATRLDEAPTFDMRGSTTVDNTGTITLYNTMSTALSGTSPDVAGVFAGIAAATPAQSTLPIDMQVQMMGRDTVMSQLNMVLPLYTGGKISAIIEQATIGKKIAQEGKRRTYNQVVYDVKRYYYGVILTKQLQKLSSDTLARMGSIRDLTFNLYNSGSLSVKKTDYLRSQLSVSLVESLSQSITEKEAMAKSALLNVLGLSWRDEIDVADTKIESPMMDKTMQSLVEDAYRFNPDFNTLKFAIDIQNAKVEEAKSGYLPSIGLTASVQNIYNDYQYGIINDTNKNSWTIGIGVKWSLFDGMRTTSTVEENRLVKLQLKQKEVLLEEGLALQIKQAFLKMQSSDKQFKILSLAVKTAEENRDLNTRAYQEDMVPTKDVIEAQLFESYTLGDYYRSSHDHAIARATADYIVGMAVENISQK